MDFSVVTEGLRFPEGPVWMQDGSVILVETEAGRITRVRPDGRKDIVATLGGGPNGAAIGPDGALYVCNNGGMVCFEHDGLVLTAGHAKPDYDGGRIERIDLSTGKVERLYDSVDGRKLAGPNDIVFDDHGAMWFSDLGKNQNHATLHGGIYYAKADGSMIRRAADHQNANGIGLSPDGRTLYAALSHERVLTAYQIVGDGELDLEGFLPGRAVTAFPGRQLLDSLAVTADGHVCVATVLDPAGIAMVDPATGAYRDIGFPDMLVTNICFGGEDMRDAWITLSSTGRLIRTRWDRPGLRLAHYA